MSGIILGTGLAYRFTVTFHLSVFILAIATTLSLQILSNLCNELGDSLKGTDADQHGRAAYGLQAGTITPGQMVKMIKGFIVASLVCGVALIYSAFGSLWCEQSWAFYGLGALAVIGAITYTLGRHSYGYMGLGDLGVFLFFGLLSTAGSYYLQTQTLTWEAVAGGVAIGLPCVGVLNLNNIRDMANDRLHGKRTFASLLGPLGARIYHTLLLVGCLIIFALYGHYWTLCIIPVWAWHFAFVWRNSERLDRQMPVLMLSTFVVALLGWV